jgi:hypothetical protein
MVSAPTAAFASGTYNASTAGRSHRVPQVYFQVCMSSVGSRGGWYKRTTNGSGGDGGRGDSTPLTRCCGWVKGSFDHRDAIDVPLAVRGSLHVRESHLARTRVTF